jgi:hypothetical protein
MDSGLDRENCWTIAEHRGCGSRDRLQHLLSRAKWDVNEIRDDVRLRLGAVGDSGAIAVVDKPAIRRRAWIRCVPNASRAIPGS